jgi:hypothetical protein
MSRRSTYVNYSGDEVSRASSEDYASISHFPEEVLNSLILIAEWLCNNDKVQQQIFLQLIRKRKRTNK